jgi:hypothetical protein
LLNGRWFCGRHIRVDYAQDQEGEQGDLDLLTITRSLSAVATKAPHTVLTSSE